MANSFKVKLVRFLGWLIFIISLCVVIAGLIANSGEKFEFGLIAFFVILAVFGFFLTRYKRVKKAENPVILEAPKKTLTEKLQEQKEKSIKKQAELQEKIDALKKPPDTKIVMDIPPQKITDKMASIKDQNARIETLERLISKYQSSYYDGEAEISDAEFDRLWDELKSLNPNSPVLKNIKKDYSEKPIETRPLKEGKNIYRIEYIDSSGKESSRDIEINGFLEDGNILYINAYCYKANAMRQFRADRIKSISIQDGDPIDNPQQFLWNKYQNSDIYKTQMALNDHADEILALIFLAKSDGKMLKNEREIIGRYIDIIAPGIDAGAVETMLKNTTCELSQFNGILKRAKSWELDTKKLVMDAASQIKALKKQLDPMEKATYEKLKAVIG